MWNCQICVHVSSEETKNDFKFLEVVIDINLISGMLMYCSGHVKHIDISLELSFNNPVTKDILQFFNYKAIKNLVAWSHKIMIVVAGLSSMNKTCFSYHIFCCQSCNSNPRKKERYLFLERSIVSMNYVSVMHELLNIFL